MEKVASGKGQQRTFGIIISKSSAARVMPIHREMMTIYNELIVPLEIDIPKHLFLVVYIYFWLYIYFGSKVSC